MIKRKLPLELKMVLKKISQVSQRLRINLYMVGGPVRDLILNQKIIDMDLLIESDLGKFLRELQKEFVIKVVRTSFLTAKLYFKNFILDIAQARKEFYPSPGALPLVEPATLEEDARRRDFTINALILEIKKGRPAGIIDYVGGIEDLKKGRIRIIYEKSFWDDPTRIIRALRYEKRLNFKIERKTLLLLKKALRGNVLNTLSPQRLGAEFIRTLKEEKLSLHIPRLISLKTLSFLPGEIRFARQEKILFQRWDEYKNKKEIKDSWLIPLFIIVKGFKPSELNLTFSILELTRFQKKIILELYKMDILKILGSISRRLKKDEIYDNLKNLNLHSIVYLYFIATGKAKQNLKCYIEKISRIKLNINGEDVKKLGILPGPLVGKILREVLKAKIRGRLKNKREETHYLKKIVQNVDRLSGN